MLKRDDYQRYSRQILLTKVDEVGQLKLAQSRVAIVGLGGLGSISASYLAAAGVGKLLLLDDDSIELNNLQRQVLYRSADVGLAKVTQAKAQLTALNPNITIEPQPIRLDQHNAYALLANVDLVLDCSDNLPTRFAINHACYQHNTALLVAAANQFSGQYLALNPSEQHGCYRCLYEPGQSADNQCLSQGILGPVVGMMGMQQALDALKYLAAIAPIEWGKLRCFDGLNLQWQCFNLPKLSHCPTCGKEDENTN